jgi:hypothetical protein
MPNATQATVTAQLADTGAKASASSAATQAILDAQIADPIDSNADIMAACVVTLRENDTTIQACDKGIDAAILAAANVDELLSTITDLTGQMDTQTKGLAADVTALNNAKTVATSIAGLLAPFLAM